MPSSFKGLTTKDIDRRLKQGRGQGAGQHYQPFINVRDISSIGRSHRLLGIKAKRIHHLFSDLELAVFLSLDWSSKVIDIREQFPLSVDQTTLLAEKAGIKHNAYRGAHQVVTTDFLVDMDDNTTPQIALSAKYAKDLEDARVIEKLELERLSWQEKGIPWYIVTDREISKTVFTNITWLYPVKQESVDTDKLLRQFETFTRAFETHPDKKIIAITQRLDAAYDQEAGYFLFWLRQLLSRRYFIFDMNKRYLDLKAGELVINEHEDQGAVTHVVG